MTDVVIQAKQALLDSAGLTEFDLERLLGKTLSDQIDFADLFRKKFAKKMEGQPAGNA